MEWVRSPLRNLNVGGKTVDTKSATGKLILTIFAGLAQFEREMMLERQVEGIAKGPVGRSIQRPAEVCLAAGLRSSPDGRWATRDRDSQGSQHRPSQRLPRGGSVA